MRKRVTIGENAEHSFTLPGSGKFQIVIKSATVGRKQERGEEIRKSYRGGMG